MSLIPVVFYDNADKEKAIAIKSNRKKSGIYRWTHKESVKSYIGSSVNLGQRFASYFTYNWIASQAKHSIICKALLKYGYSEFSLEILEYCNQEDVLKREQFYLDSLNPEYNILKTAGSRLGSEQSEETKAKIRKALTGYKHSEITKSKIKAARLGLSLSVETKAKLKKTMDLKLNYFAKIQGIKIIVLDLDTKITTEYDSIRRAAAGIGCNYSSILRYEKLQLNNGYTKAFKDRYVIVINRNK